MSESHQQDTPPIVSITVLEKMGIDVPDEAVSCYTDGMNIVFNLNICDEVGCSIVIREEVVEWPLTEKQVEELKAANYYGSTAHELRYI